MKHLVFVYGTLLRGEGNHHILEGATFLGEGKTLPNFTMIHLGGFPGVVEGGNTDIVGEVYEVDEARLARLDRLEGHPSFYRRAVVALKDGQEVEMYLLPTSYKERYPVIESGSWRDR